MHFPYFDGVKLYGGGPLVTPYCAVKGTKCCGWRPAGEVRPIKVTITSEHSLLPMTLRTEVFRVSKMLGRGGWDWYVSSFLGIKCVDVYQRGFVVCAIHLNEFCLVSNFPISY